MAVSFSLRFEGQATGCQRITFLCSLWSIRKRMSRGWWNCRQQDVNQMREDFSFHANRRSQKMSTGQIWRTWRGLIRRNSATESRSTSNPRLQEEEVASWINPVWELLGLARLDVVSCWQELAFG